MKKFLLIALVSISLTGCYVKWPAVNSTTVLDYSKYQKDGLFLTESNSVNFNYEPLGSLSSIQLDGNQQGQPTHKPAKKNYYDDYETRQRDMTNWLVPTREAVLEQLCLKAKEMGANGIINIKIVYHSYLKEKTFYQVGYEATGMAIKK